MKPISLAVVLLTTVAFNADAAAVRVQPIQVCDDLGANCAAVSTFSDYANKIYAQRGDTVSFLPVKTFNSSQYLTLDTVAEADALIRSTTGTQRSAGAYDMWFVSSIVGGRAGRAALGADGIVISNAIIPINRVDTVSHELAHNLGLNHSSTSQIDAERYLMAPGSIRDVPTSLLDVAPDGRQLSRFDAILPSITVDTIGSTPFQSNGFFNVKFLAGSAIDVSLEKLTVNLAPAGAFTDPTNAPPGLGGSPLGFSNLNGVALSDFTVAGVFDGSQSFSLAIAAGAFSPGESFDFGVDIDLLSAIDAFGATPEELRDAAITFDFSNGYSFTSTLDDLIASTAFDPTRNYDRLARVIDDGDPLSQTNVPEPGTLSLVVLACASLFAAPRTRRRAASLRIDG